MTCIPVIIRGSLNLPLQSIHELAEMHLYWILNSNHIFFQCGNIRYEWQWLMKPRDTQIQKSKGRQCPKDQTVMTGKEVFKKSIRDSLSHTVWILEVLPSCPTGWTLKKTGWKLSLCRVCLGYCLLLSVGAKATADTDTTVSSSLAPIKWNVIQRCVLLLVSFRFE